MWVVATQRRRRSDGPYTHTTTNRKTRPKEDTRLHTPEISPFFQRAPPENSIALKPHNGTRRWRRRRSERQRGRQRRTSRRSRGMFTQPHTLTRTRTRTDERRCTRTTHARSTQIWHRRRSNSIWGRVLLFHSNNPRCVAATRDASSASSAFGRTAENARGCIMFIRSCSDLHSIATQFVSHPPTEHSDLT